VSTIGVPAPANIEALFDLWEQNVTTVRLLRVHSAHLGLDPDFASKLALNLKSRAVALVIFITRKITLQVMKKLVGEHKIDPLPVASSLWHRGHMPSIAVETARTRGYAPILAIRQNPRLAARRLHTIRLLKTSAWISGRTERPRRRENPRAPLEEDQAGRSPRPAPK
jgi:hypothetical protein